MNKILPIKFPPITTYLCHSCYLSALLNYEEFLPWFYSNYIQLWCIEESRNNSILDLNFYFPDSYEYILSIPFIQIQNIFKDTLLTIGSNIISSIKRIIEEDYYICTFVDEFFIPNKVQYLKQHNCHRILIYGYDDEQKVFNICGWDKNLNFDIHGQISYKNFKDSFESDYNYNIINVTDGILCFKIKKNMHPYFGYRLDIDYINNIISDYLLSKNSSLNFRMFHNKPDIIQVNYGINIYNPFKDYLRKLKYGEVNYNIIAPHLIWEHKKCMAMRIGYLKELGYIGDISLIINNYKSLANKALICRNFIIKHSITGKSELIDNAINIIEQIEVEEKNLLLCLLNEINYMKSSRRAVAADRI